LLETAALPFLSNLFARAGRQGIKGFLFLSNTNTFCIFSHLFFWLTPLAFASKGLLAKVMERFVVSSTGLTLLPV